MPWVWFEQEIVSRLIQQLNRNTKPKGVAGSRIFADLSDREKEIALLVIEGMSNHAIGDKLFISERTVKDMGRTPLFICCVACGHRNLFFGDSDNTVPKDLKKFPAGFGIAGLAGASGVALTADQPGGSG